MGILGALSTSVSGLSAQSYALENISGNIANSTTVGFKRVNTSFVDQIPEQAINKQAAGSVQSYSSLTNTIQGSIKSTGVATNMALSGDGYFTVSQNIGTTADPVFTAANLYTRRGDYSMDAKGYLVNGAGYFLAGTSYDPTSSAATSGSTTPLKISNASIPAKVTSTISYSGNIPFTPQTNNYTTSTAGSELLKPSDFSTNPITTGTVTATDNTVFLNESIAGGEISVYNQAGSSPTVQLRWAKTASSTSGGTDTWHLYYQTNSGATGSQVQWKDIGTPVTFDSTGKMTSTTPLTITALSVNGTTIGNVNLDFSGGLTQYGASAGTATPTITQNGYTAGQITGVTVNSDGSITGSYTNGRSVKVGQVTIAHFAGDDSLKRESGGAYTQTIGSGTPTYGLGAATLSSGAVEESNTDISDEFSKMIVTQQAYSANTKVLSTAQQMLQDVINILR